MRVAKVKVCRSELLSRLPVVFDGVSFVTRNGADFSACKIKYGMGLDACDFRRRAANLACVQVISLLRSSFKFCNASLQIGNALGGLRQRFPNWRFIKDLQNV